MIGVLNLEFEGNALYFHRIDLDHRIAMNALRLGLDEANSPYAKLQGNYVLLTGRFHSTEESTDHFSGRIDDIESIEPWPVRKYEVPPGVTISPIAEPSAP